MRDWSGYAVPEPTYTKFAVGDFVRILSIGDWLFVNLLPDEQERIRACVGKEMQISEIDKWGGIWVGLGQTIEEADCAAYYGQTFIVEPHRIELVI